MDDQEARPAAVEDRPIEGEPVEPEIAGRGGKLTLADEAAQDALLYQRAENNLLNYLQKIQDGQRIIQQRAKLLETAYFVAISRTRPTDWIIQKEPTSGTEIAMLCAPGASNIAPVYGVNLENVRPQDAIGAFDPLKLTFNDGVWGYRAWADVYCQLTGIRLHAIEATRRSDEDFTGRRVNTAGRIVKREGVEALDQDLRASVWTLLMKKAVVVSTGLGKVPVCDLEQGWRGQPGKSLAQCVKGHGHGSGDDRRAQKVAEADVKDAQGLFWAFLQQLTQGNDQDARSLLKDITKNPEKGLRGIQSCQRFSAVWQMEAAWKRLRVDPVYGPKVPENPPWAESKKD